MRLIPLLVAALLVTTPAHAAKFKASKATGTELLQCLDTQQAKIQENCLEEIGDRRLVQASPRVAELAGESPDEDVRLEALAVLERLGATELLPAAHQAALTDQTVANRKKALRLIELYGGVDSQDVVGQVIAEDADAGLRRKAVIIASRKSWSDLEPLLAEKGLSDPDPDVSLESAKAVVLFGNPDSRPLIHELMVNSPDEHTREFVVRAVELAPMPLDRDPLIACLDDSNPHAARHAARALKGLGDPTVAPVLRDKAMAARDPAVAEEFSAAALHLELLERDQEDGGI
jgi:HEAT repeat protein